MDGGDGFLFVVVHRLDGRVDDGLCIFHVLRFIERKRRNDDDDDNVDYAADGAAGGTEGVAFCDDNVCVCVVYVCIFLDRGTQACVVQAKQGYRPRILSTPNILFLWREGGV